MQIDTIDKFKVVKPIFILCLILGGWACLPHEGRVENVNVDKANTSADSAIPAVDLRDGVYTDKDADFAVSYLPSWKAVPTPSWLTRLILVPTDESLNAKITVTAIGAFGSDHSLKFVNEEIVKRKQEAKNTGSNTPIRSVEIGRTKVGSYDAVYEKTSQPEDMIAYRIDFVGRGRRYMLLLRAKKDCFDRTFVDFLRFKDSFALSASH